MLCEFFVLVYKFYFIVKMVVFDDKSLVTLSCLLLVPQLMQVVLMYEQLHHDLLEIMFDKYQLQLPKKYQDIPTLIKKK